MIKRLTFVLALLATFFVVLPSPVYASLVHVKSDGEVTINVLSSSDSLALEIPQKESLFVNSLAIADVPNHSQISLSEEGGKISLNVTTSDGLKSLDVSEYKDSVVELEERDKAEKVEIGVDGGKFSIVQRGVKAVTSFPIGINPKNAEITVKAPSGVRYLAVLPFEAYQGLVKARIISQLGQESLTLEEGERGELTYVVPGQKLINVFNLFDYPVPVKSRVSATTGEVLLVEEPIWLKILGFAFI